MPESWLYWNGSRPPAVTSTNHGASHPVSLLLNFVYVLHAGRVERTLDFNGLDPHAGFLHAPDDRRASLARDLLELLRADIEVEVLDFTEATRWKRRDFAVNQRGQVYLWDGLARAAAQRLWLPAAAVDDAVAWLLRRLGVLACGFLPAVLGG